MLSKTEQFSSKMKQNEWFWIFVIENRADFKWIETKYISEFLLSKTERISSELKPRQYFWIFVIKNRADFK